jgi:predicted dehydrogenase
VLHVCVPNSMHVELARAALESGKHVICEKPLALDVSSATSLAEDVPAGRGAFVPFVYRYYPTVREARERVASGSIGSVNLIHGTYLQDWLLSSQDDNWRVEADLGGASRAFADIGSHWCDLAEFITGDRVSRLSARTKTAVPERARHEGRAAFESGGGDGGEMRTVETEDAALVQFETEIGAMGSAVISQVSPGRKNRLWIEVDGSEASVVFDQENPETLWVGRREAATVVSRDAGTLSPPAARLATLPGGHPQGWADCFDAFVADAYEAIRTGDAPDGLPGFADGARAVQITEAVLDSAAGGSWVEVPAPASREAVG